jgi:hypothetical protein
VHHVNCTKAVELDSHPRARKPRGVDGNPAPASGCKARSGAGRVLDVRVGDVIAGSEIVLSFTDQVNRATLAECCVDNPELSDTCYGSGFPGPGRKGPLCPCQRVSVEATKTSADRSEVGGARKEWSRKFKSAGRGIIAQENGDLSAVQRDANDAGPHCLGIRIATECGCQGSVERHPGSAVPGLKRCDPKVAVVTGFCGIPIAAEETHRKRHRNRCAARHACSGLRRRWRRTHQ